MKIEEENLIDKTSMRFDDLVDKISKKIDFGLTFMVILYFIGIWFQITQYNELEEGFLSSIHPISDSIEMSRRLLLLRALLQAFLIVLIGWFVYYSLDVLDDLEMDGMPDIMSTLGAILLILSMVFYFLVYSDIRNIEIFSDELNLILSSALLVIGTALVTIQIVGNQLLLHIRSESIRSNNN